MALLCAFSLVFWDSLWLAPFKLLVVTFHELGHALVAILTGGRVLEVMVNLNEGGHTLSEGGIRLLILNGGYLGSLLMGMSLLALARGEGRGRLLLGGLGVSLWAVGLLWVPVLSFGFLYVGLMGLLMLVASRKLPEWAAGWGVRGLGVFSVLYALFDIRSDVFFGAGVSDATMLAGETMVPAVIWGAAWILVGLGLLWKSRRWLV
jgi:hypothetical protein